MPSVILVTPFLDRNVGSVSRAMLNFGMTDLRLVAPHCNHLSDEALAIAAGSREVLENARVFESLQECIQDLNQVIATTARPRKITQVMHTPWSAAKVSVTLGNGCSTGIVFGPESSGLTNDDVALADAVVAIPAFKHFSSLNLAQAVNCLGYEMHKRQVHLSETAPPDQWLHPKDGERLCRRDELESFLGRLEKELDLRDYQSLPERRDVCHRNVRSIFQRNLLTKSELQSLQGVLTALIRTPSPVDEG